MSGAGRGLASGGSAARKNNGATALARKSGEKSRVSSRLAGSNSSPPGKRSSTTIPDEPRARRCRVTDRYLEVELFHGRVVCTPLTLYPTLREAGRDVRKRLSLLAFGTGIQWPELDLQLSVRGVIEGRAEHRPGPKFAAWVQQRDAAKGTR